MYEIKSKSFECMEAYVITYLMSRNELCNNYWR